MYMSNMGNQTKKRHSFGPKVVTGLLLIGMGIATVVTTHALGIPLSQYVESAIITGTITTGSMILQSALTASNKHVELDHSPELKVKKVEIELEEST